MTKNRSLLMQAEFTANESSASGSGRTRYDTVRQVISGSSDTQPSNLDEQARNRSATGTSTESHTGFHKDVLIRCNNIVEQYRKGEISKPSAYVDIQSKLTEALGDDRARTEAAFGSFITTIESHDSEIHAAARRGKAFNPEQRSPGPVVQDSDGQQSDGEPVPKRLKADESAYAWNRERQGKRTKGHSCQDS